jgi:hypothetical protein
MGRKPKYKSHCPTAHLQNLYKVMIQVDVTELIQEGRSFKVAKSPRY